MPRKKNPHSTSGQKVIGLYSLLLFTGQTRSLVQLAQLFDCSKQTILRMMDEIELTHRIEIASWMENGQKWYRAKTPKQRPNVSLTVEELQQLLLCRDIVWNWLPENLRKDIESTIAKATVLLPEYDHRGTALSQQAHARSKGIVDYSKSQEQLDTILKGLRGCRICEVVYYSPEKKSRKVLRVAPYQLLAYREGLYVRCRLEDALKEPDKYYDATFAIHRMRSVTLTQRKFESIQPKKEDKRTGFGLFHGEPFRVKVDIAPRAAMYVLERIWSSDQKITQRKNGSLRLEFTANSTKEVVAWVLSFGGEATLVEPKELVSDVLACAESMAKKHG